MLSKIDLTAIDKIVKKRVRDEIEAEAGNLKTELQSDIKMAQIRLLSEIGGVKDRLKNIEIDIRKIKKDIKTAVDFLDKEGLRLQSRIQIIEDHLRLTPTP